MMTAFRLALLNPNTDARHTAAMADVARGTLPDGCEVTAVGAARGPSSIESEADTAIAAAEVVSLLRSTEPHDAYLVACFGDPGLEAARELTDAPVVGIGEAAYVAVGLIAQRFGVITTLARGVPALEDALEARGIARRCLAVVPLDIPVADQGSHNPDTTPAIVAAGRRLADGGAEALILACGGMADVARTVEQEVGVPVCDGVSFGAALAHALWLAGLRTSKAGAYGWPEPIPYLGMPDNVAPRES
jgi:allantoin racemase